MSNLRLFLLLAIGLVSLQLWSAWERDYGPPPESESPAATPGTVVEPAALGDLPAAPSDAPAAESSALPADVPSDVPAAPTDPTIEPAVVAESTPLATGQSVIVSNDVLRLTLSTTGAEIRQAELLTYPVSLERKDVPIKLLDDSLKHYFIAQTGLRATGPAPDHTAPYSATGERFELAAGAPSIEVPLTWRDPSGLLVRKVYSLDRGSFVVNIRHEIVNEGTQPWRGYQYRQMQRVQPPKPSAFAFNNPELYAYVGAAVYSPEEKFQKLPFDDFKEEPFNRQVAGGWSAMQQHYFLGAFIPDAAEQTTYSTAVLDPTGTLPTRFMMRQASPPLDVAPGATGKLQTRLYLGPKLQSVLPQVAPGLEYTVDYGLITPIAKPLFWVMAQIHKFVGNWGLSIIFLTLLVKLAFYKLSESQYRSMAKMRKIQPKLEALKQRYGDDRQKMAQAQMELFKAEKVNPIGGCLPILLQLPVFFALYWVIFEAVELRQAPFFLWIQDLSLKDPLYILPILNVAVMWYTQKLSPSPGMDPVQKRVFQTMPLIFGVMFAFFPAGLVLYWLSNGLLGLIQQLVITKRIESSK